MIFQSDVRFHDAVRVLFSTSRDGSMAAGGGVAPSDDHTANVERFLKRHGLGLDRVRLRVMYDDAQTYREVRRVAASDHGSEIRADALYTTDPTCVMVLPVADCVATVVYDPVTGMRGLLHLGRHSSVEHLIEAFVIDVADTLGSDPRDWYVWMSPSIRRDHDRMEYFDPPASEEWEGYTKEHHDGIYIDTIGHNIARFERAGVPSNNLIISPENTYVDDMFYSQRAATETGDERKLGRMVAVVAIKPPEELVQ